MADPDWATFRQEVFGDPYMVWHDGPYFGDLVSKWEDDPALVERMILAGLAENDSLAAQSIGQLPLGPDDKVRLARALQTHVGAGTLEVRINESLVTLTGDQQYAPTEELIAALEGGLQDEDNLVRHHSAESLLAFARDPVPEISKHDDDFGVLVADDPAGWAALAAKLGTAARKANGLA